MCGKPIMVNKDSSAATKVVKDECGVVVDAHNVSEVKEAILKLKNRKDTCNARDKREKSLSTEIWMGSSMMAFAHTLFRNWPMMPAMWFSTVHKALSDL